MSYTVLARKYRSRNFEEVIGQEAIARTLRNAVKTGRLAHGYLFTGTRGSGKTSTARILAKALNCMKSDAPTTTPCCECDACRAIAEGQDIDVVEIDAASNTGVDNIRELRSNTAYRPARCRFKVYIIDEVHMLSTGAFNALLKTLEEPPGHVKFILATTEIQKVPATVRSRCQQFNFRNIEPAAIAARLAQIAKAESVTLDDGVARRVARLANGSMRDALSILDQLLSVSPQHVTTAVIDEVLPPAQNERVLRLLSAAAEENPAAALGALDELLSAGRGIEVFCADAIEVLRVLLLLRACGADTELVDLAGEARTQHQALAERFELSHYVQMIAMFEELRRGARFSGAGRALTDALIVRICRLRGWSSIEQLMARGVAAPASAEKKKSLTDGGAEAPRGDVLLRPPTSMAASAVRPAAPLPARDEIAPPAQTAASRALEPSAASTGRTAAVREAAPVVAPPRSERVAELDESAVDAPELGGRASSSSEARGASRGERRPATHAQRLQMDQNVVVQRVLESLGGVVINYERDTPAGVQVDETE